MSTIFFHSFAAPPPPSRDEVLERDAREALLDRAAHHVGAVGPTLVRTTAQGKEGDLLGGLVDGGDGVLEDVRLLLGGDAAARGVDARSPRTHRLRHEALRAVERLGAAAQVHRDHLLPLETAVAHAAAVGRVDVLQHEAVDAVVRVVALRPHPNGVLARHEVLGLHHEARAEVDEHDGVRVRRLALEVLRRVAQLGRVLRAPVRLGEALRKGAVEERAALGADAVEDEEERPPVLRLVRHELPLEHGAAHEVVLRRHDLHLEHVPRAVDHERDGVLDARPRREHERVAHAVRLERHVEAAAPQVGQRADRDAARVAPREEVLAPRVLGRHAPQLEDALPVRRALRRVGQAGVRGHERRADDEAEHWARLVFSVVPSRSL